MQMRRWVPLVLVLAVALNTAGCITSLSLTEERDWGNLLSRGVVREPMPFKNKGGAGFLSVIIPGTGHFYAGEPGLGVAYFLGNILWPINIFWTVPAAVQATEVANKRRTVEYYKFGAHSAAVEKLREKGKLPSGFTTFEEAKTS